MTDAERRAAAKQFAADWKGRGDEKQETQTFWMGGADKILDYADRPSFCLYSSGLSPPRDILIRFSRYQTI